MEGDEMETSDITHRKFKQGDLVYIHVQRFVRRSSTMYETTNLRFGTVVKDEGTDTIGGRPVVLVRFEDMDYIAPFDRSELHLRS